MRPRDLLEALKPKGYGDTHFTEALPEYLARVRSLIPTFPDQVVEQWLYRHYSHAVQDYGWLGLESIEWGLERWTAGRILEEIGGFEGHGLIESWTDHFKNHHEVQKSWLARYMVESGTWPVPIMIIQNPYELVRPDGLALASPHHLMEGHHRLGFLNALELDPATEHEVFVARIDRANILDHWPLNDGA